MSRTEVETFAVSASPSPRESRKNSQANSNKVKVVTYRNELSPNHGIMIWKNTWNLNQWRTWPRVGFW